MVKKFTAGAAIALVLAALPTFGAQGSKGGGAKTLPDGRYACQMWIGRSLSTLGYVDIKGQSYRGPSQSPSGPFKPMTIDGDGRIGWATTFSQITASGGTILGSRVSSTARSGPAFSVDYRTASGYRETIDCTRQ